MLLLLSLASAQPMSSSLMDVLSECEDVVVARMIPGDYPEMPSLEIERAIRGNLSGVVQPKKGLGYPALLTDSRFVAFLCDDLEWSVVAKPVDGDNLGGWLDVFGFYDFNAHMVDPSLLTLTQLDQLIAGEQPLWGFSGPLVALSNDGHSVLPVGHDLEVWTNGTEFGVTGLQPSGLEPTEVYLWPWDDDKLRVVYNLGYPRPLTLMGQFEDGQMQFTVREPELLTVAEVGAYLADHTAINATHRMLIHWDDGSVWSRDLGSVGEMGDWRQGRERWPMTELSIAPERYIVAGDNTIALGEGQPGIELHNRGAEGTLLRELLRGPIAVHVTAGPYVGRTGRLVRAPLLDE